MINIIINMYDIKSIKVFLGYNKNNIKLMLI